MKRWKLPFLKRGEVHNRFIHTSRYNRVWTQSGSNPSNASFDHAGTEFMTKHKAAQFSVVLAGAGNMGGALLRGWVADGMAADNISILDPAPSLAMSEFLKNNDIAHHVDSSTVTQPDVLLVAVKPQMLDTVLPTLKSLVGPHTVVVSVIAGKTVSAFTNHLGDCAVIRSMPNTPALVQRGISVACANAQTSEKQIANVDYLLRATGKLEWVEDEGLIDAVTAVSGSGPAYVFHLAECMAEAGVHAGLPPELATKLALETVSGAGELLRLSDDTPKTLRENVTSPGGTTAAALEVLMAEDGMPKLLKQAVLAAQKRSRELS